MTLSACGSENLPEPGEPTAAKQDSKNGKGDGDDSTTEPARTDEAWVEVYREILANPGDHPVNPAARYSPTGQYSYALVEANSGGNPELLLAVEAEEFSPVIVFTTDGAEKGKATASTDNLIFGASSVGGARIRLESSASGTGIYQIDSQSTSPKATSQKYTLEGTKLVKSGSPEEMDVMGQLPDHQLIEWTPSDDTAALRAGLEGSIGSEPEDAAKSDKPEASESNGDDFVFTGVVRAWSTTEALRGAPTPNRDDPNNIYYVLVFDEPLEITAFKPGSDYTQVNEFISLGEKDPYNDDSAEWEPYVGKRVKLTVPRKQAHYSSDTSIPLGALNVTPSKVELV